MNELSFGRRGVFGVSGPGFINQRGPDGFCVSGNCRSCMRRQYRSGVLGSLRLMSTDESLVRDVRTLTYLTFLI